MSAVGFALSGRSVGAVSELVERRLCEAGPAPGCERGRVGEGPREVAKAPGAARRANCLAAGDARARLLEKATGPATARLLAETPPGLDEGGPPKRPFVRLERAVPLWPTMSLGAAGAAAAAAALTCPVCTAKCSKLFVCRETEGSRSSACGGPRCRDCWIGLKPSAATADAPRRLGPRFTCLSGCEDAPVNAANREARDDGGRAGVSIRINPSRPTPSSLPLFFHHQRPRSCRPGGVGRHEL